VDITQLILDDHHEQRRLFAMLEQISRADTEVLSALWGRLAVFLELHAAAEEEIFYPAFWSATGDKPLHHEAEIEHQGAKNLIAEIEKSDPADDYFDARVTVLSEMIKHHVKEEEQPGGMFAEARRANMDLTQLGEQLAQRKSELQSQGVLGALVGRLNEPLSR